LGKYTYYLYAPGEFYMVNNKLLQRFTLASCFFEKNNKSIFLITSAHTVTGQKHTFEPEGKKVPDTFYLRLYKNKTGTYHDLIYPV
jgi:hypothetical protein